jgi:riboflavin kinase/FMN adenylyltransferase
VNTIGTRHLIVGYDHRFGHNREGSFKQLLEYSTVYDFTVEQIPEVDVNAITVSSTKIRNAILNGDMETASKYLERNFTLHGEVVEGNKLGRTLGFPTANIEVHNKYKILPKDGVYAVHVLVDGVKYGGMLNIGNRPTINGSSRVIEVNIFNFESDIYKETIGIEFIKRTRDEIKFPSLDSLKDQLLTDQKTIKELLGNIR